MEAVRSRTAPVRAAQGRITPRTHHACHGLSTAIGSYCCRTQATASFAGMPSSTANAASAVPVLPRPPRQATSTASPSRARRRISLNPSKASSRSRGTQKSGQTIRRCGHGGIGPSANANRKSARSSGISPSFRPRTRAPEGNTTVLLTPASSRKHGFHSLGEWREMRRQAAAFGHRGHGQRELFDGCELGFCWRPTVRPT